MIRFIITISDTWLRTIACDDDQQVLVAAALPEQPATHWSGKPAPAGEVWYRGGALRDLIDATGTLVARPANPADPLAPRMARFLFDALIGDENWKKITAHAQGKGKSDREAIELALRIDSPELVNPNAGDLRLLHGLCWELMCSVAVAPRRMVTVTRLIASAGEPTPLSWPPRILFALSSHLKDQTLRPAMEAMGMLSHFELGQGLNALRPGMYSRVVENVTLKSLKVEVNTFEPEIVYFICHGQSSKLLLKKDDSEQLAPNAANLIDCFTYGKVGRQPSIVILAACESATVVADHPAAESVAGPQVTGSLASQLVGRGIPIVIGMAGKISSAGCRLFTRALADSLFQQHEKSLVESVCQARAVARAQQDPRQPAEWALPTLFMADNDVTAQYKAIDTNAIGRRDRWEYRVRRLNLAGSPIFCCRDELERVYDQAVNGKVTSVVFAVAKEVEPENSARSSTERIKTEKGKSRALKEIGVWALRDGHIPFPVLAPSPAWNAPRNAREIGVRLLNAIDAVRSVFGIEKLLIGELFNLLVPAGTPIPAATDYMRYKIAVESIARDGPVSPVLVRWAFGIDAAALRQQIVAKFPHDFDPARARCVVLLDDAHNYWTPLMEILFPVEDLPATNGFGNEGAKIPVFAAMDFKKEQDLSVFKDQEWLKQLPLDSFPKGLQSELAYERVLLHPFDAQISEKPLCFDLENPQLVQAARNTFHEFVAGYPGALRAGGLFGRAVRLAKEDFRVLVEADDASVAQKFIEEFNAQ